MGKKKAEGSSNDTSSLTHNPFAKLANAPLVVADRIAPSPSPAARASSTPINKAPPVGKVRMRLESKGRSGKVVTRMMGLPFENLDAIATRLRKALGCGAMVEGEDVLLLGSLVERASQWLDRAGDLRAITAAEAQRGGVTAAGPLHATGHVLASRGDTLGTGVESVRSATGAGSARSATGAEGGRSATEDEAFRGASTAPLGGNKRSDVRRGQRVAIVLKADQETGKLTEGIVRDLLTSSPYHPRGIKVRLESGEVGRVKTIYG